MDFAQDWVVAVVVALDQLSYVFCGADNDSLCSGVLSMVSFFCHKHADYDCSILFIPHDNDLQLPVCIRLL